MDIEFPTAPRAPVLRSRALSAGYLRAFLAVAEHLNFRAAAEDLSLTQSAISRQIQSLEDELGVPLFRRHTRAVELTGAGQALLGAVRPSLERIDSTVRQIRATVGRKQVAITTFASFSSLWLIPRLEKFQQQTPDVDFRIDGTEVKVDLEVSDVDLALRYGPASSMPPHAIRLFGEELAPVASPWLLQSHPKIKSAHDLAKFPLIEAGDAYSSSFTWLSWRRWLDVHGLTKLQPKRWLYFNFAHQMIQAALTGQGLTLARTPLVASALTSGELVEPLPKLRIASPMSYWLIVAQQRSRSQLSPHVQAFVDWVQLEARVTRESIGQA
jgi:LysR family transcriptional regulator, glycine cleavage system transcriptional activator